MKGESSNEDGLAEDPGRADPAAYRLLDATDLGVSCDAGRSIDRLNEAIIDSGAGGTHKHGEIARRWILDLFDSVDEDLADRRTVPGHLTGSALVLDPTSRQVLLMLHSKLDRWLQPGGHADGDHELAGVALREASEETGIDGLRVLVPAIDLDIHVIPARGEDPEHLHLDLRFVVISPPGARPVSNHESKDLRWIDASDIGSLTDELGLVRLVDRGIRAFDRFSSGQQA